MFSELGVAVYIADIEAKKLTNHSKIIRRKLIQLLGPETYNENGLNREYVASKIFTDAQLLEQVNSIIHPKVAKHFERWVKKQQGPYCIKEAAILFENGGYKKCDKNILVVAPVELRIERVMLRDNTSKKQIQARISNQWSDEKKMELADYIIENIDIGKTKDTVLSIHKKLLKAR